jgi:protein-tyrosine phosphatase
MYAHRGCTVRGKVESAPASAASPIRFRPAKMACTIYVIEGTDKAKLGVMARPRGGDWLDGDMSSVVEQGFDVVVSLLGDEEADEFELQEEESICTKRGLKFIRLPIRDRDVPVLDSNTLDAISYVVDTWVQGKAIVVHCRMAYGRAPMIAACLMIAQGRGTEETLKMISAARGFAVPETENQRAWIYQYEDLIRASEKHI